MIKTPRWKSELDICRSIKSLFIFEGEINDLQLYEEDGEATLVTLEQYLYFYLKEIGYDCISYYNRIDGFSNDFDGTGEMIKRFYKIAGENSGENVSMGRAVEVVRRAMKNCDTPTAIIMNLSSLMLTGPDHMQDAEIERFATLLLGSMQVESANSPAQGQYLNNLLFLTTHKANDLPAWLYLENPYAKVITLEKPSPDTRRTMFEMYRNDFSDWDSLDRDDADRYLKKLITITDGFSCYELNGVLTLCAQRNVRLHDAQTIINTYRYGQKEDPWEDFSSTMLSKLPQELKKDVIGQDCAIREVSDIIKRAANGLSGLQHSSVGRPKGVMFFAGPTGTGKTELAKSLARNIFGDESALIRFDMSEYAHEHSDQRLLGAPPGYVGYNAGGELTNAVKAHPFSILLFDEIEKAHPTILDKFLQILDDGRLTDSKGETIYFTETIIIFTSNKGIYKDTRSMDGSNMMQKIALVSAEDSYKTICESVKNEISNYFISELGRPEILNRIGNNLIVFDFIRPNVLQGILHKQISNVFTYIREVKKIEANLDEGSKAWRFLIEKASDNLEFGGRGVGNIVEKYLLNPLARRMSDDNWHEGIEYSIVDITESEETELVYVKREKN